MSLTITPQQIKDHRAARKAAGMVGCKDGSDMPLDSLKGISWRPADPMNPSCFCHDCRDSWDSDASVDVQLIQNGNTSALWTYASLLPEDQRPVKVEKPKLALPMRSNGGGVDWPPRTNTYIPDDGEETPPPVRTMTEHPEMFPPLLARSNGGGVEMPPLRVDTSIPRYGSFDDVPDSLPAPRHRDIMNEAPSERLRKDLGELRMRIQGQLVQVMDKKRRAAYYDEPQRSEFVAKVNDQERALWAKLDAIDLLLKE